MTLIHSLLGFLCSFIKSLAHPWGFGWGWSKISCCLRQIAKCYLLYLIMCQTMPFPLIPSTFPPPLSLPSSFSNQWNGRRSTTTTHLVSWGGMWCTWLYQGRFFWVGPGQWPILLLFAGFRIAYRPEERKLEVGLQNGGKPKVVSENQKWLAEASAGYSDAWGGQQNGPEATARAANT